jgi:hypothetical protein
MIRINVSADIERAVRGLREVERKQIPFATAQALTATAKHAQASITAQLPSIFDRPTAFTMRAIAIEAARKNKPTAAVFVRPIQAEYLALEETGGFRRARKSVIPQPVAIGLNAYGNIPRNKIAQLARKPSYFIGTIKGVQGLYRRPEKADRKAGHLQLLARFVPGWSIKPKFKFIERVTADVRKTLPAAMQQALDKALG